MKFEIRKIWSLPDSNIWHRIASIPIGKFQTNAKDQKRAFLYALHKLGIVLPRGKRTVIDTGNGYEVKDRRSGQPLYVAIQVK